MAKIMITVFVPAIGASYDLRLPSNIVVKELLPLIVHSIEAQSAHTYAPTGSEILCHDEFYARISSRDTLDGSGVRNGDRIFLM